MSNFSKLFARGVQRHKQNDHAVALQLWQWALEQTDASTPFESICSTRYNIALCYYYLGRYEESLALNQAVLEVAFTVLGQDHELVNKCRSRIASCRKAMAEARGKKLFAEGLSKFGKKDYNLALNLWSQAGEAWPEGDRTWTAIRLMNMALCNHYMGRYVNAAALAARADEFVKSGALDHDEEEKDKFGRNLTRVRLSFECQEAHQLMGEGQTRLDTENWDGAESSAEAALQVLDGCSVGRDSMLGAKALDLLATACYQQSRYREAAGHWREARRLAEKWSDSEQPELKRRIRDMLERCKMH